MRNIKRSLKNSVSQKLRQRKHTNGRKANPLKRAYNGMIRHPYYTSLGALSVVGAATASILSAIYLSKRH